jgi:tetratricopeptide (TPR) repeat protein
MNKSTVDTSKQLSKDFCLGLIYAELYNRGEATKYLINAIPDLGQSNKDMLFVAYLLLADIYKHQRKYTEAIENLNYALEQIQSLKTQKDRVVEMVCCKKIEKNNAEKPKTRKIEISKKIRCS